MTPIATILVSALLAILAWIGKEGVTQLKKIANSVQRIEVELGVLSNDHINLKKDHDHFKAEVKEILSSIVDKI